MTIIKRFLYVAFVLASIILVSTKTFAVSVPTTVIPVGEVNIEGVKITDQVKNNVSISFVISNGKGIQSGVKYGVSLVSSLNNQVVFDEKVYEEELSLPENTKVSKTIVYSAPEMISGKYLVYIKGSNTSGFPFGNAYAGTINLEGAKKWISLDPESCSTSIVGATDKKVYKISETPTLREGQSLQLSCLATNTFGGLLAVTPLFNTFEQTIYGNKVEIASSTSEQSLFKTNEKKIITTLIPKVAKPQIYVTRVSFGNDQQQSNPILVKYRVEGPSAVIVNASADKDYYAEGDTANILLIWQGNNLVSLQAAMTTEKGSLCGKSNLEDLKKGVQTINIPVSRSCVDPNILITIKDLKGNILAEKKLEIKTVSFIENNNIFSGPKGALLVFLIVSVIILTIILFKKRKLSSKIPPSTLLVLVIVLGLGLFSKAEASQYAVGPYADIIVNVNIGSPSFSPGAPISVEGSVYSNASIDNTITFSAITIGNSSVNLFPGPEILPANGALLGNQQTLTAPVALGSYSVDFTVGVDDVVPVVQNYYLTNSLGGGGLVTNYCTIGTPAGGDPGYTAVRDTATEQSATRRGVTRSVATFVVSADNGCTREFVAEFFPGQLEVTGVWTDGAAPQDFTCGVNTYCTGFSADGSAGSSDLQEYF